ncbi:MAG: hypothetical protein M0Z49_05825 [Chloroflexi bacterium]|nr:hypothetical protein [Chloroflexota bacterium]MDA8237970.1 hypothetical protein [Chloroflexota bacterium]
MSPIRSLLLLIAIALAACGPAPQTVAGFVIDVKSTSLTEIQSFTLRTQDGQELVFRVGPLELDGGAFPAGHLREHMALSQPVAVAYREESGERVAYRLVDATWLQP